MATAATTAVTGRRFVIALMCAADGCPVAVEVFEGNTADPVTLAAQIDKLKQHFHLQRVVMVGDRGLLTSARIEQTLRPAGLISSCVQCSIGPRRGCARTSCFACWPI